MRILIIEDEERIVRFLDRALTVHGYTVRGAETGEEGLDLLAAESFDFVLLDIMLPGSDGHQVLSEIRQQRPDLPVIMLTARDDVTDKVSAFDSGADDYLTKPFAVEELLARIRALRRRAGNRTSSRLRAGDLEMDIVARRVRRGAKPIDLSTREFALLEYFLRHPGQTLNRRDILSAIWEYDFDPESNLVDVYVRYLRKKLDRPDERSIISTVRGEGYRLEPQISNGGAEDDASPAQ